MGTDNDLKHTELATEWNYTRIDGISNTIALPLPQARQKKKPKVRVKESPAKRRSREREER